MQVNATEQGIIVKHFLKVRCQPLSINRVTMETTAKLIIDTSMRHLLERGFNHLQLRYTRFAGNFMALAMQMQAQQKLQRHRIWKLWCPSKTSIGLVKI